MQTVTNLQRFRLEGKIGEGADSEVFAATDADTGEAVVLKRPHPALIMRGQHGAVERRMSKVIALRGQMAPSRPQLSSLLACTAPANHDAYFGDALSESYIVVVEERASGVPLVASATDGIKGHPIGAPQNLFALHPVVPHRTRGRFSIVRDLMEVAEAFENVGALILDLRPQNIYFEPRDAGITVIDIGGVTEPRPGGGRNPPLDLHDFYLELFKWYVPLEYPPQDAESYGHPVGMDTVPMFNQNLDTMMRRLSEPPAQEWKSTAIEILSKVKQRDYPRLQAFRNDFEGFLTLLEQHYDRLQADARAREAWQAALSRLTDEYWRKYRFDPLSLQAYSLTR